MSLLPPNASDAERALEQVTLAALALDVPVGTMLDPHRCPAVFLPWLAWHFSVDAWDPEWTEAIKRSVIAGSLEVHRRKGTLGSIKRALASAGAVGAEVTEAGDIPRLGAAPPLGADWVLGVEDLHWADYFVTVGTPLTLSGARAISAVLAEVAPVRCRLRSLRARSVHFSLGDGLWSLGPNDIALGATYETEILNG